MKTSGPWSRRCNYFLFIGNILTIVILFLNVSPLNGKFTSLEASEGLCPAPGTLPVAENANYPWLLIGRRYYVPMASRHAIHKYAEVFLGHPARDQHELNRMNLQIEHILGKYRKMGFDREFRQLCLSESKTIRRFPRNLLERYCYIIRSWLSGEGTDVNLMATSLDTIVWTDNHTAILVTKCINHMYYDWEVYSIGKTLLPHVRDQILQVVQFLGFGLHNVLYYDYDHHKFYEQPIVPLIAHGPAVGLITANVGPFKALPLQLPPPALPPPPPSLEHHHHHLEHVSLNHIPVDPHPHYHTEFVNLNHIPVDPHHHHHPHQHLEHITVDHHHHEQYVNDKVDPHHQHHVEYVKTNHADPNHPSVVPVVHASHGLKGHVQEKQKLRDYGPMSYYAVEIHPDPKKGYYSHPPPEFLKHHHEGQTHVIQQDPIPHQHQHHHNHLGLHGGPVLTGPSGPVVPINYAPLIPSYSEDTPVQTADKAHEHDGRSSQMLEGSKKLLQQTRKFAEQQQTEIQQLYHNPVLQYAASQQKQVLTQSGGPSATPASVPDVHKYEVGNPLYPPTNTILHWHNFQSPILPRKL